MCTPTREDRTSFDRDSEPSPPYNIAHLRKYYTIQRSEALRREKKKGEREGELLAPHSCYFDIAATVVVVVADLHICIHACIPCTFRSLIYTAAISILRFGYSHTYTLTCVSFLFSSVYIRLSLDLMRF